MREALLYTRLSNAVRCEACAHNCVIHQGQTGICNVRKNIGSTLFSLNSDKLAAANLDPVEKKPLYHFLPGSMSLSVAAKGCNFKCVFCQNHTISQHLPYKKIVGSKYEPKDLVHAALKAGADSISYTYTEPSVYPELVFETAECSHKHGLKNILVTNGFFSKRALDLLIPLIDAVNVDLKSFSDDFYKKYCSARLEPVINSIKTFYEHNVWIEITTLIIPGLNDSDKEISEIINFIHSINPLIPWHVSRFFPVYKLDYIESTRESTIINIIEKAHESGLNYVYAGNTGSGKFSSTLCHLCSSLLIDRNFYNTKITGLNKKNECMKCKTPFSGIISQ